MRSIVVEAAEPADDPDADGGDETELRRKAQALLDAALDLHMTKAANPDEGALALDVLKAGADVLDAAESYGALRSAMRSA